MKNNNFNEVKDLEFNDLNEKKGCQATGIIFLIGAVVGFIIGLLLLYS
jgi:hypothetical protein